VKQDLDVCIRSDGQPDEYDQHGRVRQCAGDDICWPLHPPGQECTKYDDKSRRRAEASVPRLVEDHDPHRRQQEAGAENSEPEPLEEGAVPRLPDAGVPCAADRVPLCLPRLGQGSRPERHHGVQGVELLVGLPCVSDERGPLHNLVVCHPLRRDIERVTGALAAFGHEVIVAYRLDFSSSGKTQPPLSRLLFLNVLGALRLLYSFKFASQSTGVRGFDPHVDDALDEPALKLSEAHALQLGEAHVQVAISDVVLVARPLRPLVGFAFDPRDEVLDVSAEHPWLWVAEIERDLG
jgi:hypothetical protein